MELLIFALRNLLRNKKRTIFTALGISVSLFVSSFLLTMYMALIQVFASGGRSTNLCVIEREVAMPPGRLPIHYLRQIRSLPHVEAINAELGTTASSIDETSLIMLSGIDADNFIPIENIYKNSIVQIKDNRSVSSDFKETVGIDINEKDYAEFKKHTDGIIVGKKLVMKYGWKVGEVVKLKTVGGACFKFRIWGFFGDGGGFRESQVVAHQKYIRPVVSSQDQNVVSMIFVKADMPSNKETVISSIDDLFMNYPLRTRTITEKAFLAIFSDQLAQMKNFLLGMVLMAVVATLIGAVNSIAIATRERIAEIGTLRALGFSASLILATILVESILTALGGGLIGLSLSISILKAGHFTFGMGPFVMIIGVHGATVAAIVTISVVIGIVGGLFPALNAMKMSIVESLGKVI